MGCTSTVESMFRCALNTLELKAHRACNVFVSVDPEVYKVEGNELLQKNKLITHA